MIGKILGERLIYICCHK